MFSGHSTHDGFRAASLDSVSVIELSVTGVDPGPFLATRASHYSRGKRCEENHTLNTWVVPLDISSFEADTSSNQYYFVLQA
ncbi:hypothetical protein BOTNAR_0439g00060 [Botryotinia narcissicola]|uniref:Uncharacterized protein n=1 Tax=Botryotinia narcissicola TaxID=278944 RepID=A0A4Z1HWR9_9HELO|nr:hypothetical protein BOTNAR_0439g00060 [Botryotinia narcissicola]